MPLFRKTRQQETPPMLKALPWTTDDPPLKVWGSSVNQMANAVQALNTGPKAVPYEVLIESLVNAQVGFSYLTSQEYRTERSRALASACDDMAKGLTFENHDQVMRGYDAAMELVKAIAAEDGIST